MTTILLTGATGKTGAAVAELVAATGHDVRALVRDPGKAGSLEEAGLTLVTGDVANDEALARALDGVERALLILPNSEQQLALEKKFIDAAKTAGVRHIVKLSSTEAVPGATGAIPQVHVQSEEHLKNSGLAWTMIRPNFFMQNLLASAGTIRDQSKFFLPMGDGKTAMSDIRDIAAVMAAALTEEGHENKSYDVTGPELLTFHQVAERFSEVLGRPVTYVNIPLEDYMKILEPYLTSQWHADAVAELFAEIAAGGLERTTDDVRRVLGREPISLTRFIEDHILAFKGS